MSKMIVCPVYGNNEVEGLFEKQGCKFVRCRYDQLVYINPQPDREELQEVYDTYGKEFYALAESVATAADYPDYRQRFLDFRKTNRLLEIGAAAGGFLLHCRRDGWETYGVELSAPSSKFAARQLGLDVSTGTIHDAGYPDDSFDVVVAWQTLEHVPNPREVSTEIFRILRLGGFLFLSVPCWEGLSIRLLKERYRYVGRDHLFYFSPPNLRRMLTNIGFSKVTSKTGGFNPIVCCQDGLGLIRKSEGREIKRDRVSEIVQEQFRTGRFLKAVHKVYYHLIERLNLGDTLFAEAMKE